MYLSSDIIVNSRFIITRLGTNCLTWSASRELRQIILSRVGWGIAHCLLMIVIIISFAAPLSDR